MNGRQIGTPPTRLRPTIALGRPEPEGAIHASPSVAPGAESVPSSSPLKLNGWQRLGVLFAIVWTITVGLVTWSTWPPTLLSLDPAAGLPHTLPPVGADVTLLQNGILNVNDTLTRAQFAARLKTKYPEYKDVADEELVKRTLEKFPQYALFVYADNVVPDDLQVNEFNRTNRRAAIRNGLALWLMPLLVLGGLGYGVAWVYRGFKPQ